MRIDLAAIAQMDPDSVLLRHERLAAMIVNRWQLAADEHLHGTAGDYKAGIVVEEVSDRGVRVVLEGTLANIVEQGMGPGGVGTEGDYDAKKFVLKPGTRSLRRTKDGRLYVNIPFGHSSGALGSAGLLAEAQGLAASRTNPEDRWRPPNSNLVDPNATQARTSWGGRLKTANPLYRGVVRMEKTYSQKTESSFVTWRRMIEGGKPWMTRGVKARHLAERFVVPEMPQLEREAW